jgi:hypothetical protein
MRDAVDLLLFVDRIEQSIGVNDFMIGIGKNRKIERSFAICGNLFGELFTNVWWVDADRIELDVLLLL